MSAGEVLGVLAAGAAILQIAAMGFIAYPILKRRPGGMAAFHRSGFLWWLVTLTCLTVAGLVALSGTRTWSYPSSHGDSVSRLALGAGVGLVVFVAIELVGERLIVGDSPESRRAAMAKYEGALPRWARSGAPLVALVVVIAVLEEFVFRAVALGSLWYDWGLPKAVAAGIVVVSFGLAHWYYGFRQVVVKLLVGSALTWAALTGGWVAAALAHAIGNVVLTAISSRRSESPGSPAVAE